MNKKRLLNLADRIEKAEYIDTTDYKLTGWDRKKQLVKGFNMANYFSTNECGTAACVAGYAVAMYGRKNLYKKHIDDEAMKLLDLNDAEANCLFDPEGSVLVSDNMKVTPKQAAEACRYLANDVNCYDIW